MGYGERTLNTCSFEIKLIGTRSAVQGKRHSHAWPPQSMLCMSCRSGRMIRWPTCGRTGYNLQSRWQVGGYWSVWRSGGCSIRAERRRGGGGCVTHTNECTPGLHTEPLQAALLCSAPTGVSGVDSSGQITALTTGEQLVALDTQASRFS